MLFFKNRLAKKLYRLNVDCIQFYIEKYPDCTLQDIVDFIDQQDKTKNKEIINLLQFKNRMIECNIKKIKK